MKSFHKSRVWKSKRKKILRRDSYMCRECSRYGRTTEADTVHHVYPIEQHPEWALASWNLISLCDQCHNKMHDRVSRELTSTGKAWVERVTPPPLANK